MPSHHAGVGDDESQRMVFLDWNQMMEMVGEGWVATLALGLLNLGDDIQGCCPGGQTSGLCFGEGCR